MRLALLLAMMNAACFAGSNMGSANTRTGHNPRSDRVIDLASAETGCAHGDLRIVLETDRRFLNETVFRFVLEGCGERLGFVEDCSASEPKPDAVIVNDTISCRYVMVSRLPLHSTQRP